MLYLIVYLFDVYGPILKVILWYSAIAMGLAAVAYAANTIDVDDFRANNPDKPERAKELEDQNAKIFESARKTFGKGLFALILYILLPSKQGLAMLGGVYVGTEIYEGLNKSTLVEKSVKILNKELDNYLDQYIQESDKPKTESK